MARNITRNSSGFLLLDRLVIRDNFAQTIDLFAHVGKAYFCYVGPVLISSSRDSHCRFEKFAPLGKRETFRR